MCCSVDQHLSVPGSFPYYPVKPTAKSLILIFSSLLLAGRRLRFHFLVALKWVHQQHYFLCWLKALSKWAKIVWLVESLQRQAIFSASKLASGSLAAFACLIQLWFSGSWVSLAAKHLNKSESVEGPHGTMDSILRLHPAAPGSILSFPEG